MLCVPPSNDRSGRSDCSLLLLTALDATVAHLYIHHSADVHLSSQQSWKDYRAGVIQGRKVRKEPLSDDHFARLCPPEPNLYISCSALIGSIHFTVQKCVGRYLRFPRQIIIAVDIGMQ